VLDQVWGRALEQVLPQRLESVDDLFDQSADPCPVAAEPPARVGDADPDVAHLVPHRQPLRLAQAGGAADSVELRRHEVLVRAPDRVLPIKW
jgi:hypothetical protein